MRRVSRVSLVAAGMAVSIVTGSIGAEARADFPNSCGRYLGIGWSDGYHSHSACPPKAKVSHPRPVAVPVVVTAPVMPAPAAVPWWKIPAAPPEAAPIESMPAPATDGESDSSSSAGQSLFRQPGEGTSVMGPVEPRQ